MRRAILIAIGFGLGVTSAYAGDELDEALLQSLSSVPMVDVLECKVGDERSLAGLNSTIQFSGGKTNKKTKKALAAFEERVVYWSAVLDVATETDLRAGQVALEERQAERKKKLSEMSVFEQSVYLAKRDYPCDDIFEDARKSKKKANKK